MNTITEFLENEYDITFVDGIIIKKWNYHKYIYSKNEFY